MVHYTLSERVQHTSQTAQMSGEEIHYGPEKDRSSAVCSSVELLTGSNGEVVKKAGMRAFLGRLTSDKCNLNL